MIERKEFSERPETVVVEFVVRTESDESTEAHSVRVEHLHKGSEKGIRETNLCSSILPHRSIGKFRDIRSEIEGDSSGCPG